MSEQDAPMRTFAELCAALRLGKDTVRKHLKSTDPDEYWPHERFGRQYRFTDAQWNAIVAKHEARGTGAPETITAPAADIARALARRRRDMRAA